ncbi:hypothetical protein HPB50_016484 [Hyalomma asiaticum]|uniref:Uncharacterized protein n=1 Tax=Hyalomma asiaticum TaxID=266040 RepID=A0ACB7RXA3_HYAAI|nr:hypothetical protein HPB50_016484 [Hyalomma asiaticum]
MQRGSEGSTVMKRISCGVPDADFSISRPPTPSTRDFSAAGRPYGPYLRCGRSRGGGGGGPIFGPRPPWRGRGLPPFRPFFGRRAGPVHPRFSANGWWRNDAASFDVRPGPFNRGGGHCFYSTPYFDRDSLRQAGPPRRPPLLPLPYERPLRDVGSAASPYAWRRECAVVACDTQGTLTHQATVGDDADTASAPGKAVALAEDSPLPTAASAAAGVVSGTSSSVTERSSATVCDDNVRGRQYSLDFIRTTENDPHDASASTRAPNDTCRDSWNEQSHDLQALADVDDPGGSDIGRVRGDCPPKGAPANGVSERHDAPAARNATVRDNAASSRSDPPEASAAPSRKSGESGDNWSCSPSAVRCGDLAPVSNDCPTAEDGGQRQEVEEDEGVCISLEMGCYEDLPDSQHLAVDDGVDYVSIASNSGKADDNEVIVVCDKRAYCVVDKIDDGRGNSSFIVK